ncbi:MAG: hypothetical protein ACXWVI_02105 [Methyloceanibacter sp.]
MASPSDADYFSEIFEHDWDGAFHTPGDAEGAPEILTPQSLRGGGFIQVERADYEEV